MGMGNQQKSLKRNFIMNIMLTMSSFIFPLITFPYISRILLPTGTGKVSFATSLISYFSMFAQLGIPTYGIRACAKVRDNREKLSRTAHELLAINLLMNLVSYISLIMVLIFVPKLQEDRMLYVILSFTIILTSIGMEWLYKALEQYTYITIRSIFFKFIALAAMFLLIHEQEDYIIYGGITIFAASASNIFNFFNVHKYIDLKIVGNYNIKRHLKPVGVFFAMACATTIYTHLDIVMLGFMATDTDVGYYNAAIRIKSILVSIVTSLGAVLLPRASYYIEHNQISEFKRISKKAINFVLFISIPMMLYFIIFAREVICVLSGSAYMGAIAPMQLVMPTLLLIGLTNILGIQILVPLGKENIVLCSEIAGAVIDVIINALLIPKYTSKGAAIGTLIAEFVVLIIQYRALSSNMADIFKQVHYSKIMIGSLLGLAATIWIKTFNWGDFIILLVSGILFLGVYGIFLIISKEELAMEILKLSKNI